MCNVSIAIVTYNSENYIEECIDSIIKKTNRVSYEIIVVDNSLNDKTESIIKEKFQQVNLIKNNKNYGFAKAANQAAKVAKGKYILFLNPDTKLKNEAVDILYSTAEENGDCVLFGAKLSDANGKYVFSCGFLPSVKDLIFLYLFKGKFIKPKKININKQQNVEIICGADFFVSKPVFEKFSGFDEDYFMYCEELDFCKRLNQAGKKVLYVPASEIIHYEKKSQVSSYRTTSYTVRNSYLYCVKNFYNINKFLLRLIFIILLFLIKDTVKNLDEYKNSLNTIFKY